VEVIAAGAGVEAQAERSDFGVWTKRIVSTRFATTGPNASVRRIGVHSSTARSADSTTLFRIAGEPKTLA
jgi:hypothetical protein